MKSSTLSVPASQLGSQASLQAMLSADAVEIVPDLSAAESRVLQACHAAQDAEHDYATKAIIAGMLLNEYRHQLACSCHSVTGRSNELIRNNQHSSSDKKFAVWVESHGLNIRTAYRWITASERVARHQLNLPQAALFSPFIDVEGTAIPLSQALTAPEAELPEQARKFRQGVFDFMADKTLAEATRAAVEGESPAHRITRAAAGKTKGGTHAKDDRKQYPLFTARALADALTHIGARINKTGGHWSSLNQTQKHEVCEHFNLFVAGLDDELLAFTRDAAQAEINARKKGKRPEPLALRAAVNAHS